jgi:hypothetical protein
VGRRGGLAIRKNQIRESGNLVAAHCKLVLRRAGEAKNEKN